MKKLLLSFIFLSIAFSGWSFPGKAAPALQNVNHEQLQTVYPFTFFNAHRQGHSSTGLMWRTSSPGNVLSFLVERSYDGEFFDPIQNVPCNGNTRFAWKDDIVFPGYIYYRIAASLMDGTTVYSEVQVVRIVQK